MVIQIQDDFYVIKVENARVELSVVRSLPSRRWVSGDLVWHAPFITENHAHLVGAGFDPDEFGIDPPTVSGYYVGTHRTLFMIKTPFDMKSLCQRIPEYSRWSGALGAWTCKKTRRNVEYLMSMFKNLTWTSEALEFCASYLSAEQRTDHQRTQKEEILAMDEVEVLDYKWGTQPYEHQAKAFKLSRDAENFALLMEQGTGKTKVAIDTTVWMLTQSRIDALLVVCPNGVKSVWPEEWEIHCPDYVEYAVTVYSATMKKADREALEAVLHYNSPVLDILVMNVEAFSTPKGVKVAEQFLRSRRVLWTLDESSRIKTPGAKRTKSILKLRHFAAYRRILSGTPITGGPLDYFTQMKFLDPDILGFGSYYAFRNHFCVMISGRGAGGQEYKEIVEYKNLDELIALVDPHSFRVERADCLDLPEKIYQKFVVELSSEQKRIYKQMKRDMIAELSSLETVTAPMVLVQILRLQQITGGFIGGVHKTQEDEESVVDFVSQSESYISAIEGSNPKLLALLEIADDVVGKVIVWSRFRPEIEVISAGLRKKYGADSVVEFHGGISIDERTKARLSFQDPESPIRFFVGNPQAGGLGITLTEAQTVIYYSNSFSLEQRLQSEDRVHRIGLKHIVTYIDLLADNTVDIKVLTALREKKTLASLVQGDQWREWV